MKTVEELNSHSTLDDFIEFYEAVPEEKWGSGTYYDPKTGKHCALGLLGETFGVVTQAALRLRTLTDYSVLLVNDWHVEEYDQPTPKQRILAYLKDIKNENATKG